MPQPGAPHSEPLITLVGAAHGTDYANRLRSYDFHDATLDRFREICVGVLRDVRREPGACTLMNALLAQRLCESLNVPFAVVAGALKIGSTYVFGSKGPIDGARVFSTSALDFDGHVWMVFGRYLVDISLARTGLSGKANKLLADTVRREFGDRVGLIAMADSEALQAGFVYLPRYVLPNDQIAPLALGARAYFGLTTSESIQE